MLPPLAICLVTWNHWADTQACLKSVLAAGYDGQRQVWVVDNASADGTAGKIEAEFPEVLLIRQTWNAGFAGGMNLALAAAQQALADAPDALLLLLNNDTVLDPACLSLLATAMEQHRSCGIAAPTIYYHGQPDLIWYAGGGLDPVACRAWHEGLRTRARLEGPPHTTGYATGCALLVRSRLLKQIGLLDEGYFMYWEDADLCLRARQVGWQIMHVPQARLWHKVSTSTGGNLAPRKLWRKFASGWRFWSRWHEGRHWPLRFVGSAWQDYQRAQAAR